MSKFSLIGQGCFCFNFSVNLLWREKKFYRYYWQPGSTNSQILFQWSCRFTLCITQSPPITYHYHSSLDHCHSFFHHTFHTQSAHTVVTCLLHLGISLNLDHHLHIWTFFSVLCFACTECLIMNALCVHKVNVKCFKGSFLLSVHNVLIFPLLIGCLLYSDLRFWYVIRYNLLYPFNFISCANICS